MNFRRRIAGLSSAIATMLLFAGLPGLTSQAIAQEKKPNIIFIMGADVGWSNIGVYNQGIMAGSRQARQ
jgi:hypothetical protein